METDLQKKLGSGEFEYGNHRINVEVRLEENYGRYYRIVQVLAARDDRDEVSYKTADRLNPDPVSAVPSRISKFFFWTVSAISVAAMLSLMADLQFAIIMGLVGLTVAGIIVAFVLELHYGKEQPDIEGLEGQLERTTGDVFDKLDEFYEYTSEDYDIDIDVSIDRVKHEISWIEIEDDLDRILAETESIA